MAKRAMLNEALNEIWEIFIFSANEEYTQLNWNILWTFSNILAWNSLLIFDIPEDIFFSQTISVWISYLFHR